MGRGVGGKFGAPSAPFDVDGFGCGVSGQLGAPSAPFFVDGFFVAGVSDEESRPVADLLRVLIDEVDDFVMIVGFKKNEFFTG
jgi:hypothetical protein